MKGLKLNNIRIWWETIRKWPSWTNRKGM